MRKRKIKDSKMTIIIKRNWLIMRQCNILNYFTILILISSVVDINGLETLDEKPLIVENYTAPLANNHTNSSTSHATTVRNLDVTTISNYDSIEYDNMSGDLSEGGHVVR